MSPLEVVLRNMVMQANSVVQQFNGEGWSSAQDNAMGSLFGAIRAANILLSRIDELRANETANLAGNAQIEHSEEAATKEVANLAGLLQSVGNN